MNYTILVRQGESWVGPMWIGGWIDCYKNSAQKHETVGALLVDSSWHWREMFEAWTLLARGSFQPQGQSEPGMT